MSIEVKRENFMAWMDFFELGVGWIDSVHGCASGCPENENHPPPLPLVIIYTLKIRSFVIFTYFLNEPTQHIVLNTICYHINILCHACMIQCMIQVF